MLFYLKDTKCFPKQHLPRTSGFSKKYYLETRDVFNYRFRMLFALSVSVFTVSTSALKATVPFKLWRCKSDEHKFGYQLENLLLYNYEQPGIYVSLDR